MLQGDQLTEFREKYWRKKACVFRSAIDISEYPLLIDEICQLTQDDLVESRMIDSNHELLIGPFENDDSANGLIPKDHLLLVQCIEQHLEPAQALLRREFHFVPAWQVDDVMASIGDTGATCGAHFDQYDVFLLQHQGNKQWQLDNGSHLESDLDDNLDIRLLREFTSTETYELEPGDVLYVPPGVGHYGICEGTSMTLSVGIRNPTPAELLADLSEFMIDGLSDNLPINRELYHQDGGLPDSLADELFHEIARLFSPTTLQQWYGCYVTRLREPDLLEPNHNAAYNAGMALTAALPTRLSYVRIDNSYYLFVNGEVFPLPGEDEQWAVNLCSERFLPAGYNVSVDGERCLLALLYTGAVV